MSEPKERREGPLLVRLALLLAPADFRRAHGDEILADVSEDLEDLGPIGRPVLVLVVAWDLLRAAGRLRRRPVRGRKPAVPETGGPVGRRVDSAGRPARHRPLLGLAADLRFAARGLLRTPGHSTTVVFTLCVALALAVVVYAAVHGVLLRPLPYQDSEELVLIERSWTERGVENAGLTAGDLWDVSREVHGFEDVAGVASVRQNLMAGSGHAELVDVGWTTDNLFRLLGVEARLGRLFLADEDPEVVVLSHEIWSRSFGGSREVLGETVQLDGWPYTVVGVLPPEFDLQLVNGGGGHDVWRLPDARWSNGDLWSEDVRHSSAGIIRGFARLEIGEGSVRSALTNVSHELRTLSGDLQLRFGEYGEDGIELRARRYHEALVEPVRPMLLLFLGAAGFVVAVACSNVMHLVLVRAGARADEIGMRKALGATRWQVGRLVILESLLLALVAGGLGIALSAAGLRSLEWLRPEGLPRFQAIGLHPPVVAFGLATAFFSTLAFGLWPAWRASRSDLSGRLRGWRLDAHDARLGPWLVGTEIALCLVLLVGAGLLLRSLQELRAAEPGFHLDDVLTFSVSLPSSRYDYPEDTGRFLAALEREMATVPGVEGISSIWPGPLSSSRWSGDVTSPTGEKALAEYRLASSDFFRALGIRVVAGRTPEANDPRERVVLSRSAAERFFPGAPERAVGRTLTMAPWGPDVELEILGVVEDARLRDLRHRDPQVAYFDSRHWSWADWEVDVVVRATRDPLALVPELRDRLADLDREIPLANPRLLEDLAADQRSMNRFALTLVGVFAGVAALLVAVGLYGVVAFSVSRRRREMGIRLALGSDRRALVGLVLGRGVRWIAGGLAVGLGAAVFLARLLESLLFGVGSADPSTFAVVSLLLAAIGLAACLVPALRASRVDPAEVLRSE